MSHISTRLSEDNDIHLLVQWLMQPGVLRWFPLTDLREVEDAARIWMASAKYKAVLTALYDGVPCGVANLYLQPYKKLAHQCLFAIVVDENYRGRGVGTQLLKDLIAMAKEHFHLEILHLEVYEGNPAVKLYKRLGFQEYGFQKHFVKENGQYLGKLLMQKRL
jgi:putative acetyltransferase